MGWFMFALAAAKAANTIAGGEFASQQGSVEYKQKMRSANRTEALSQREAIQLRREQKAVAGRARAVAGASGAGVDDPTMEDIINRIEAKGDFNMLSALYDGTVTANDLRMEGAVARSAGRSAKKSAFLGSIASMGSSMVSDDTFQAKQPWNPDMKDIDFDFFMKDLIRKDGPNETTTRKYNKRIRKGSDAAINWAIGQK